MEDNEEIDYVAPEHDRLVNALSKLDKTQHINEPTRNEPTNLNSEFNLIKRSSKLNINNVVKVLEDTAHNVQIGKQLKKSQVSTKVLPKPLEKPQAERIKRATGYEETKKIVGRWDPVVARSRTVDFVSFPLKNVTPKLQPTNEFLTKLVLKSPLEKQLDEVDPPAEVEEELEEEPVYPMSYEEMVEHRQHLAKIRARQSYTAAKTKRQSKIKSKKFHRILKKERLKSQLKEFEELQKKDPEEALKKLEALEKARALERHTLRHKNTGKWAKSKLVRAKYDKEVRQELAEQLSVSKNLTHKTQQNVSSDDEDPDNGGIADIALSQDPLNPWMMRRADKPNVDEEFNFGYKKYLKDKLLKKKADSDSDSENSDGEKDDEKTDIRLLKTGIQKIQNQFEEPHGKTGVETKPSTQTKKNQAYSIVSRVKNNKHKLVATSNWIIETIEENKNCNVKENESKYKTEEISNAFDSLENETTRKINQKLKKMRNDLNQLEKKSKETEHNKSNKNEEKDSLEYLSFKNKKMRPTLDEPLLEAGSKIIEDKPVNNVSKDLLKSVANSEPKVSSDIDPTRFIKVKPKYLNTAIDSRVAELDDLDDEEQVVPKVNIEEVFEEDDVVASFRQEKEDEINKDKPQDIDLTLPGWGSWGGKGVKTVKRRKNRFIVKAPPKMPRRDENKGDIIIKEYKDPKLAVHKVTDVPFPFTSVKDYEASIRAPLGNSFVPENAHQKLIKPSVITKAGAIIEPMDEDELLVKKNKTFRNESIIKLLGHN